MLKKRIIGLVLVLVIALTFGSLAFADTSDTALPYLKLAVDISPIDIYPTMMIYTAQLSYLPTITTTQLVADFYNINSNTDPVTLDYLGSIPFDKMGKAVLHKQMKRGYYIAISKTVINGVVVWSNKVEYKVP